jgi:HPt (histidine-containing phosphotransfer) domain-containing protein
MPGTSRDYAGNGPARDAGDAPGAKALAHKLKGSCLGIGAERMAEACHAIELAAATGAFDRASHQRLPALFASLERLLAPRTQPRLPTDL